MPTLAVPKTTSITRTLTELARRDRAAEEARRKLRAARAAKKAAQAAQAAATTPDSANPGTPTDGKILPAGMLGEKAPEVKMTKKEREKLAKQDVSDEVATRNANTTASLQLAGMGKSYSWMKGGGSSTPKPPGAAARALLAKAGGAGGTAAAGSTAKSHPEGWTAKDRQFGEWREDSVGGRGIQLRDWVGVLEMDGRERTTLGWAMMKMGAPAAPAPLPGAVMPGQV